MLFLFSLCPEVFAASVSIITYKVFVINILYIYTFNYLYLKQSSVPYFAAALYCFLSPVLPSLSYMGRYLFLFGVLTSLCLVLQFFKTLTIRFIYIYLFI